MNNYASRPQNQPGRVKKHRATKQLRFNEQGDILCTYCVKYKPKEDYLDCNLSHKHYICGECEREHRKKKLGNINRLIDNVYGHQKASDKILYTWDQLCDWLHKETNFVALYQDWKVYSFEKEYTPTVIRIDASKPFSLDNLRVTTAAHAREYCTHKRERKVIQMDDDGKEIANFSNARVAAQFLNYKCYSNIHEACKGTKKRVAGYRWKYA